MKWQDSFENHVIQFVTSEFLSKAYIKFLDHVIFTELVANKMAENSVFSLAFEIFQNEMQVQYGLNCLNLF